MRIGIRHSGSVQVGVDGRTVAIGVFAVVPVLGTPPGLLPHDQRQVRRVGPGNVWVFSLGAGAYAAHYSGRSWAKVKLPAVPTDESTAAPDDIWALGTASALQWNGTKWTTTGVPELPLPKGATVSYSNLTAAGPNDAWLLRTISSPSRIPATTVMHWNGKSWLTAASPADIDGSIAPDGHGGLWTNGIDVNPGGFWLLYHLGASHWTTENPRSEERRVGK